MPLFGLGVLILWLGWFGFNPGSTLNALDGRFAEILLITNLAAAAGVLAAVRDGQAEDGDDRHRHGRQRRDRGAGRDHRSVRLRRGLGGADHRRGRRRDRGARRVLRSTSCIDDPVGALSAHGLAGIWGTISLRAVHRAAAGPVQRASAIPTAASGTAGSLRPADRSGGRVRDRVHVRVRAQLRHVLGDQEDDTGCASPRRRKTPGWTSPSTACTATRSSSSRSRSTRPAPAMPAPPDAAPRR